MAGEDSGPVGEVTFQTQGAQRRVIHRRYSVQDGYAGMPPDFENLLHTARPRRSSSVLPKGDGREMHGSSPSMPQERQLPIHHQQHHQLQSQLQQQQQQQSGGSPSQMPKGPRIRGRRSSVFGAHDARVALASQVGRTGTEHMGHGRNRGGGKQWGTVAVIPVHSSAANIPLVKQGKRASWNLPTLLDGIVVDSSESEDEGEDSLVKHKSMHDIMHDVEHGLYKNKRLGISRRKRAFQAPTIDNGGSALSSARSLSSHGLGVQLHVSGTTDGKSYEEEGFSLTDPEGPTDDFQLFSSRFVDGEEELQPVTMAPLSRRETLASVRKAAEDSKEDLQLNSNQLRLVYLIGLYTPDDSQNGDEWIRLLPVMVLMYEGVLDGVFEYSYSPSPVRLHGKQVYLNVCQEGLDDLNFLRKVGLLQALKVTSETYVHSTALRLAPKGLRHLRNQLTSETKICVQRFASVKLINTEGNKNSRELLKVLWEAEEFCFYLEGYVSGAYLRSSITEVEAISYVLSPYMPAHLKAFYCPTGSMADRVEEVVAATRSEVHSPDFHHFTLDTVRLMLSEWVPMGGNAIVALNDRLGVSERVQGGFFTAAVDEHPSATLYQGALNGLTSVRPLDYDEYSHVNFEAEVFFPTEPGTVQLESFSVHCSEDGHVMFGGVLEVTTGCGKDAISADVLSRLLIDLSLDSSEVVTNLFNSHQQDMLTCILLDEPEKRDKFGIIMADSMKPELKAADVLEKGEAEKKVRQVVGDIKNALDVKEGHLLVVGRTGLLLTGPDSRSMEPVVLLYAQCEARSIFLKSIFSRCYIVVDILNQAHVLLRNFASYPENLEHLRAILAAVSEDILLLQEVQRSMLDSITGLQEVHLAALEANGVDNGQAGIAKFLQVPQLIHSLRKRSVDLQKTITGCKHDMAAMQQMLGVIEESQRLKLSAGLRDNTKNLEELFRDEARNTTSLEIINVVFAGSLAFQTLDRVTGSYLGIATSIDWISQCVRPYITGVPFVWLTINLLAWGLLAGFIFVLMRISTYMANRLETVHCKLVVPADVEALREFLSTKQLKHQGVEMDSAFQVNKYTWQEPKGGLWRGMTPKFELEVDERNGFLLSISTQLFKGSAQLSLQRANILLGVQMLLSKVIGFDRLESMVFEDNTEDEESESNEAAVFCLTDMIRTWRLPSEYALILEALNTTPSNRTLEAQYSSTTRKPPVSHTSQHMHNPLISPSEASSGGQSFKARPTMTNVIRSLSGKINQTLSRAISTRLSTAFSSWVQSNNVIRFDNSSHTELLDDDEVPSHAATQFGTSPSSSEINGPLEHSAGKASLHHSRNPSLNHANAAVSSPQRHAPVGRRNTSIRRIARQSLDQRPPEIVDPMDSSTASAVDSRQTSTSLSAGATVGDTTLAKRSRRATDMATAHSTPTDDRYNHTDSRRLTVPAETQPTVIRNNRSLMKERTSIDWNSPP